MDNTAQFQLALNKKVTDMVSQTHQISKKFEKIELPLGPLIAMTKSGKQINDALKEFFQEQVIGPQLAQLKDQEMSKLVTFDDLDSHVSKAKQQTLQEVDLIRRKSLSSDQFERQRDEINTRIDTLRKTMQDSKAESKTESGRFNQQILEMHIKIGEKCEDRRADKLEDKIFQCAERSRVEKLEEQVKNFVTKNEF